MHDAVLVLDGAAQCWLQAADIILCTYRVQTGWFASTLRSYPGCWVVAALDQHAHRCLMAVRETQCLLAATIDETELLTVDFVEYVTRAVYLAAVTAPFDLNISELDTCGINIARLPGPLRRIS